MGINLMSGALPVILSITPQFALVIGLIMCIVSGWLLAILAFGKRTRSRQYRAVILYDPEQNTRQPIPRYDFVEAILGYFEGAFAEFGNEGYMGSGAT